MKEKIIAGLKTFWDGLKGLYCKAKDALKNLWVKAVTWILENPEKFGTLCGLIFCSTKYVIREKRRHDDHVARFRRFYDRRTDTYCWARRDLSPLEYEELEYRYQKGERKRAILADMGLLKW